MTPSGVAGVELLVDADRAVEVALALEKPRLDEQEVRRVAGGGEPGIERRRRRVGAALRGEQARRGRDAPRQAGCVSR